MPINWEKFLLAAGAGYIIMDFLDSDGYAKKKDEPVTATGRPGGRTYPNPKDNSWPKIKLPNLGPPNNDQPYYPGPAHIEPFSPAPGWLPFG